MKMEVVLCPAAWRSGFATALHSSRTASIPKKWSPCAIWHSRMVDKDSANGFTHMEDSLMEVALPDSLFFRVEFCLRANSCMVMRD